MYTLFAENIFGEQLVKNISLTLAHSVWQGMAAAILALLIMAATKKASAALRYDLLIANLLLFVSAVVVTFLLQPGAAHSPALPGALVSSNGILYEPSAPAANTGGSLTGIVAFLNTHAVTIVFVWLLLTALRLVHLFIGYWSINRIKKTQVAPVSDFWNEKLAELVASVKVSKPVRLLQSTLVKTPMVISYFKPVILIPASLLTTLPQDEIEAILLHELSHIRRKDFLVNLLQNLIETVFFFNPFVYWMSGLIREERENCCDDLAVSQLKNKATLIKAIVACREFSIQDSPRYALAFGRPKEDLLNRVKRIIHKTPRPFHATEKFIFFLCVPLLILTAVFPLQAFQAKTTGKNIVLPQIPVDTIPAKDKKPADKTSGTVTNVNGVPHNQYEFRRNNVLYKIEKVENKITSLKINGQPVAGEKMQEQLPLANTLIAEYNNIVNQPLARLQPVKDINAPVANTAAGSLAPIGGLRSTTAGLKSTGAGLKDMSGAVNDLKPAEPRSASYYDKGYRLVVQDSVVVQVYYKGTALTAEKIKEHQAEIDGIFKSKQ